MFDAPDYADFYVAVLTIVPIVPAGQLLLMRAPNRKASQQSTAAVLATLFGHLPVGAIALAVIVMALMVSAGSTEDSYTKRSWLLWLTVAQVTLGVVGIIFQEL